MRGLSGLAALLRDVAIVIFASRAGWETSPNRVKNENGRTTRAVGLHEDFLPAERTPKSEKPALFLFSGAAPSIACVCRELRRENASAVVAADRLVGDQQQDRGIATAEGKRRYIIFVRGFMVTSKHSLAA